MMMRLHESIFISVNDCVVNGELQPKISLLHMKV